MAKVWKSITNINTFQLKKFPHCITYWCCTCIIDHKNAVIANQNQLDWHLMAAQKADNVNN